MYLSDIAQSHDRVNVVVMLVARIEGDGDVKAADEQSEFPFHWTHGSDGNRGGAWRVRFFVYSETIGGKSGKASDGERV